MDLFQIIRDIEKVDPEVYDRFDTRRRAFQHLTNWGKKVTAAALPMVVGTMFQKAYGQTTALPDAIQKVLNLALSLEYLEFYFYDTGLKVTGLIPNIDRPAFEKIRNDESGHIKTLRAIPGFTQAIPDPTRNAFDYSGGGGSMTGPFAPALVNNYPLFLGASQSFVDTGIRAYKGGAPILMSNKTILESALNIHSVEARHSSHVRTIRRGLAANQSGQAATTVPGNLSNLNMQPKSWISGTDNGGASPTTNPSTAPIYNAGNPIAVPAIGGIASATIETPAESNVTQGGLNVQNISTAPTGSGLTITAAAASEAFDEPLDAETVKAIARNFRSAVGAGLGLFNPG